MNFAVAIAFSIYLSILFVIGLLAYRRSKNASDFILGSRSTGYWVTAIAAHASDMSGWLFMAFPAAIYLTGTLEIWTAVSLTLFMYLNWKLVAPRIRTLTENYNTMTLSTFFEKHFGDTKGLLRITSALFCLYFFIFYISANLITLGLLFESAFGLSYTLGICIGVCVVFYVLLGGFLSISWIDFFQGLFLLAAIIFVPLYALYMLPAAAAPAGLLTGIREFAASHALSLNFFPQLTKHDILAVLNSAIWGLGYFGQPHIITKFMGIRDVSIIKKAQVVGLSWQIITLSAAVLVGFVGMLYFPTGLANTNFIFIELVQQLLPSFIAGFVLCAILATAINVMGAQVLVSASVLSQDLFNRFLSHRGDNFVLAVSRLCVLIICGISLLIAFFNQNLNLYSLILYAWTGLGCTFGPLMIATIFGVKATARGAFICIMTGGLTAALWPLLGTGIPAMLPGFMGGFAAAWLSTQLQKCSSLQRP
jgi:sodium/proline symporter